MKSGVWLHMLFTALKSSFMSQLFVLVDCNNFYVSCERLFDPKIRNNPVAVLSNNDGCFVARSDEVKQLNIPMGAPFFRYKNEIKNMNVKVFSSNYALYGDISARVMKVLAEFSQNIEIYSIDEAFLLIEECENIYEFGRIIKETVYKKVGIPVSVGFGKTKTLAKLANHTAKFDARKGKNIFNGVFYLDIKNEALVNNVFYNTPISEIWGIGRKLNIKLNNQGIFNINNLLDKSRTLLYKKYGMLMLRLIKELEGEAFYTLDTNPDDAKSVSSTRSFSKPISSLELLKGAVAMHVSNISRKLRKNSLYAGSINVFVMTNRFEVGRYFKIASIQLPISCNYNSVITKFAFMCLEQIFKRGLLYKKVGVIAINLTNSKTENLFSEIDYEKNDKIGNVLDKIDKKFGRNKLRIGSFNINKNTEMASDHKSKNYTTSWKDLLLI